MSLKFYKCFTLVFLIFISTNLICATSGVSDFFKSKTKIPDPVKLRDPFKASLPKIYFEVKKTNPNAPEIKKTYLKDGVFSNLPQIEGISIDQLKIVGVLIGKERRAIAKNKDAPGTFILKEGMRIGPEKSEIKAILPGGVVLVEQVTNVYGEIEYVETIIPVTGGTTIEEQSDTKTNSSGNNTPKPSKPPKS